MNFDEDALRRAIKDLVRKAIEEKTLEKVGKKTVLRHLRECGVFEADVVEDENFKKKAVAIATPLLQAALDQQEEDADPDIVRKSRAKKRKSQPDDSDEEMQDARPTKKTRPPDSKKKKEKAEEEDVSMADGEGANLPQKKAATNESKPTSTAHGTKEEAASPPKTPVNRKPVKPRKKKADLDEESEDGKRASTPSVLKNGSGLQDKSPEGAPNREETLAEVAELSYEDLSVLDPDSPKKEKAESSRKKSDSSKAPKPKKERKVSTSKGKENDPDEEEIKRLKNFVVACGIRKQWKKVFDGIEDKPKKQIARLKEILAGLGMTGRLSMDKAKAIREKRELATELEEVVAFEAKRGARTEKKTEKHLRKAEKSEEDEEEEEEEAPHLSEEEQEAAKSQPRRRKNILAFLDDQSDDNE